MKKTVIAVLLLTLLMVFPVISPAFSKNLNLPYGADRVDYVNAGGQAEITLPPLPSTNPDLTNYPTTATMMRFSFSHTEIPNDDKSFDTLLIWLYLIVTGATEPSWQPFAYITTDKGEVAYQSTFWKGSFINFDATLYYMNPPANTIPFPSTWSTNNVIGVDSDVLKVLRHGNDVTVTLTEPQSVKRPLQPPPGKSFMVPAFSLEVTKYGGSVHYTETKDLIGYPGASGYLFVKDNMGFNANGVVTSVKTTGEKTWMNGLSVTNAMVTMQGTHTSTPLFVESKIAYWTSTDSTLKDVSGSHLTGYTLALNGNTDPNFWYYFDIKDLKLSTGNPLPQGVYMFFLTAPPTTNTAFWSYWTAKGVTASATPGTWQWYMWRIINGGPVPPDGKVVQLPMFGLKTDGAGNYDLMDGLTHFYSHFTQDSPLRLNGDYPKGTYAFTCRGATSTVIPYPSLTVNALSGITMTMTFT